ncbi:MAG: hypothetical protein ACJAV6_000431 [Candidatus Paceibacteria bacterium]|jgi:hypothetical protein
MESLLSGMFSRMGDGGIEKIAQSAGIDLKMAKNILSQAGPLLTGKMADNAKTPEGLNSLTTALEDHDGSVFDRMEDVVNPDVDTKGSNILSKILGGNMGDVVGALAGRNNTDNGTMQKVLEMAAPLVLGQLGSEKKSGGLDAGGIFDLLKSEKKNIQSSGDNVMIDLAQNFLDKDDDDSVVDDIIEMAGGFLK